MFNGEKRLASYVTHSIGSTNVTLLPLLLFAS
jgi:hypothetical protein